MKINTKNYKSLGFTKCGLPVLNRFKIDGDIGEIGPEMFINFKEE